ncbi:MAG: hypothetical protein ACK41V_15755 [Acidovorax sp.]|uniref:hypothetical protein n=1 Tax=Acidovorax sp. TaxID=1872122 RepID=UPI0039191174
MKMHQIPFATTDWAAAPREEKSAEAGQAFWRTQQFGDVRVRMVEYTPGYVRERVCGLAGVALERNRDEWMLRMRRMGSCPCKQSRHSIARFRSNPSGSGLGGRSAALRRLWIAGLSTAPRALHPIPARYLCDSKKTLNTL